VTAGLSATGLANGWLNTIRGGGAGTTFTADAALYIELHIGDPGSAGTANPSAVTTRQAVTFGAAAVGAIALSNSPAFTMTATETITHIAVWNASSAGTFRWSAALTSSKAVVNTDTLTFTSVGVSLTPLAA
jgi:hypothetical protein